MSNRRITSPQPDHFPFERNLTDFETLPGHARKAPVSRRDFLRWAGVGAVGLAYAACTPRRFSPGPHGSGNVQIVYQDWRTDWFPGMVQGMLSQFHQAHPNIQVFFTPDPENLDEQMLADFQSGTAPDVLAGCCDFLPAWAQKGYLLDLRPFIEADLDKGIISEWDLAQYRALSLDGGMQFALPKYHGALALFYNPSIFIKQKLDYPDGSWSHDDYYEAMKRLTSHKGDGTDEVWGSMMDISWDRIQIHVNGWGGHFVDPDDPYKSRMGDQEALNAMNWIRERIWSDHVMASYLDVNNLETRHAFIQKRVAMIEDGSWALKDILENAPFQVGVTTFPSGPVKKVTLATTDGFAIYAGTKYPEAAWEFLKFLVSREYGAAMVQTHLLQPARLSLVRDWINLINKSYPVHKSTLNLQAFAEGHQQGYSVTAEIFPNMSDARRLALAAWEQIYMLGQSPVEMMRDVSAQIEQAQSQPR